MLTSDAPPWVTNGSGMPGDRHDPEDHPDVDDELEQDHRRDAGREQRPERVARPPAGDEDPPEQQRRTARTATIAADEPELLGERREHEVGGLDRQEVALRLGPVGQALAEEPAGPDRDLRLVELVAGALDVRVGVEERRSAAPSGSRAAGTSTRSGPSR